MKPDWFVRRARKELATPWVLNEARLAMLLRTEHRAVVRLVKRVLDDMLNDTHNVRRLKAILYDALARRAR